MKKAIKLLSVIAIIGLLGMFFCGCDMLDEMKSLHGTISQDRQTVSFKGEIFKRLPDDIPYYFNSSYYNSINITDEDVPVLLSEDYSYESYYDGLNGILAVNNRADYIGMRGIYYVSSSTQYYAGSTNGFSFYCSDENYEEYSQFKTEDADRIGFDDYNEDYNTCVLSSVTSQEIFDIIEKGNVMSSKDYEEVMDNWADSIYAIYKCNKSMTLRGAIDGYELHMNEYNEVYLVNYITETALKLSDKASEEIIKEYFEY